MDVVLYGSHRKEEATGDLLVAQALRDEGGDFQFARRKPFEAARVALVVEDDERHAERLGGGKVDGDALLLKFVLAAEGDKLLKRNRPAVRVQFLDKLAKLGQRILIQPHSRFIVADDRR